ncbi:MAG TPA: xanthine dehydrogenase family protein molybdopterin-binding subunit [Bryobacteraceae bacterium]|nr:xanthine dehydrogenase family protein molybdopterin-binding subunit [Bryobacteraceae bacterium]
MPDTPTNYSWPEMSQRKLIGKRISRLDGVAKSSGRAKYSSDLNPQGLLHAVLLTCPHAHARVRSIDTSAADKMKGVTAVRVISPAGTEIQWAGTEVAAVAAENEELARDAVRAIKVDYEVLPHAVREEDLSKVSGRAKPAGEQITGDPDKAFTEAEVVAEGSYGIPVITHCCLEPHGQTIAWQGDNIRYWPSTQAVSTVAGDLAQQLKIPATNIHVQMDYMGGGFGSKFPADRWGGECAHLSKASGGRPVKLFLDRATELTIGGVRPSHFARIKMGAKKDGTITAWQSESWSSGGFGGGGMAPIPYVFTNIPNVRRNHTAVSLNAGPQRAWRAPNHPQASYLTCSALEDLAAKLNMDPLELFMKNISYTPRPETYSVQLQKAAELIEWKKLWHPRGEGKGHIRRGLGIGINTWGGAGHAATARAVIHPDGSVEIEMGTQDLGVGTRTVLAQVAGETYGLPLEAIKIKMGDNKFPAAGPSGGSTTVGGVCSATRKASVNAVTKLFEAVAPGMNVPADQLEAVDGRIRVKGNPDKGMSWKQACQKLGAMPITETGSNEPKNTLGLNTGGAAGVQMADVSVDIETGRVKINRFVAVQDCGLIVNPKLTESQIYGAMIMSACSALVEERVMDQVTGRVLNADMEFYKLAGIADIGELIVHMQIEPEHDKRGIIGIGEPPAVGGVAAIANAVANAAGVRVPRVPLTPRHVLTALAGSGRNA